MRHLAGFAQDAVEAGFRCKVFALVRQPGDYLARRQAGKFGAIGRCQVRCRIFSFEFV